jgi:DNA-binding NarL/FixJ family response regulator
MNSARNPQPPVKPPASQARPLARTAGAPALAQGKTGFAQGKGLSFAATRAGADGYLTKPCDRLQLAQAITDTMAGHHPVSPTVAGFLLAAVAAGPGGAFRPHLRLTDRENEVMRLLSEGLVNKEIADRLGVSLSTINAHLHSSYTKLGVQNRVEAVRAVTRA